MTVEKKFIYNNQVLSEDELHSAGILLSKVEPTSTEVYGLDSYEGLTGTRFIGDKNDVIVVYDDPVKIVYLNPQKEDTQLSFGGNAYTLYDEDGNTISYTSYTANITILGFYNKNNELQADFPYSCTFGGRDNILKIITGNTQPPKFCYIKYTEN